MSTVFNWKYGQERIEEEKEAIHTMNTEKVRQDKKDAAETIFQSIEERAFVTTSPNDGSYITVIRAEDVLKAICDYYGVDPKDTKFSDYRI
jgi:hypothetical protein